MSIETDDESYDVPAIATSLSLWLDKRSFDGDIHVSQIFTWKPDVSKNEQ